MYEESIRTGSKIFGDTFNLGNELQNTRITLASMKSKENTSKQPIKGILKKNSDKENLIPKYMESNGYSNDLR